MQKVKVENMYSPNGNQVANQFIIKIDSVEYFQSYKTVIAKREKNEIILDCNALEYSVTTLKYLKEFLNTHKSKKELQQLIDSGFYKTENLNAEV